MADTEVHECTDYASIFGGYLCTCGEPWLIVADHCVTQPDSGTAPGTGDQAPDRAVTTSDEGTPA